MHYQKPNQCVLPVILSCVFLRMKDYFWTYCGVLMQCPQRNPNRTWEYGYPTSNPCHFIDIGYISLVFEHMVSNQIKLQKNTICTNHHPFTLWTQILIRKKSSQTWPCNKILTSPYFEDAKTASWGCWRFCESWKPPMLWINTHLCNKSISV